MTIKKYLFCLIISVNYLSAYSLQDYSTNFAYLNHSSNTYKAIYRHRETCEGRVRPNASELTPTGSDICGSLEHGVFRVKCEKCHTERLVAFSCKRRGFCPSCSSSRMVESAALLMGEILPEQPHRQWMLSMPYPLRWLFAQTPEAKGKALRVVIRVISNYLIKRAGQSHKSAKTGAVTLIQRFDSAPNLNVHFHMLFLDGVYVTTGKCPIFRRIKAPTAEELTDLVHQISVLIARMLERNDLIVRDQDNTYLDLDGIEQDGISQLQSHSISYRIAVGPGNARKH